MLNIVLFGPPGAGKGTQSKKLCDKYQLQHLSTGDLLRDEIARGTVLGIQAKSVMNKGELVSDEIVIGMIESKLDANPHAKGFIFDGFPRTQAQAKALDELLEKKKSRISMMVALEVDDNELLKRLLLRGEETGRPDDRNEEVIRRRIYEYNSKTAPLKQYYSAQKKFHSVYGMGSVENIFDLLCATIDNKTAVREPYHDGTVTVADISVEDEPAKHMKENKENKSIVQSIKETVMDAVHTVVDTVTGHHGGQSTHSAKTTPVAATVKKAVKTVKKAAASVKKSTAKAAKKAAPKKAVKKVAAKPVKKAVKKASAKKAVKTVKKAAKKTISSAKKAVKTAKKAIVKKKSAPKKAVKKAVKKAAKKVTPARKAGKKTAVKKRR